MKLYRIWLAVGIAALSTAASAKDDGRAARCWLNGPISDLRRYQTGAVPVNAPGVDDDSAGRALAKEIGISLASYVQETYGIDANPDAVGCHVLPSVEAAQAEIDGIERGSRVVFTNWTRGSAPSSTAEARRATPQAGPGLIIADKDSSAADLAAERAARDLAAQKEAAAINAKKFADAARNDAANKMKIAKFLEDMKKRGNAQ